MNKKVIWRRILHNPFFMIGGILALLIIFTLCISPLITTYDPIKNSLTERLSSPEWFVYGFDGHILGTDQLGRDVFTRLLRGGLASLMIAFSAVFLQLIIGTILGMIAGYFGKWVDAIIMRACDVFLALPNIILAIAIMAILGPNIGNLIFVLTVTGWVRYCKVTRNNVMTMKKQDFVNASRVLGASSWHIMFKQIFPNITTPLIIMASSRIGNAIIVEAALSYLQLGIPAPTASWGNMIADGRQYLVTCPWLVIAPGVALMITVLAFNFLGDGIRDVLDPKKL